ncbi:CRISPR-associated endonuclease Cas1 [Sulfuricurvum sp.]|uniref:CRISPR-associated endonuclease Cas1 n=1 Tax=Sulfuricurvum sp. TaxID=2025608 RepID=UPI002606FFA4|nr:CRISPR-associated endonuclease Cas1 [Sulfuricurvum sp.]MDD3596356.1 CRISPR-associated endonuclease Cas1 [Sulfuricurvum sp.]
MFTKPLEHIFTAKSLKASFEHLNPRASGIDHVTFEQFKYNLQKNISHLVEEILSEHYAPEPMQKIEIRKEDKNEKRPLSLSSVRDKLVQSTIAHHLSDYFDKTFSDKSYAYRPGKSHIKALNRTKMFLDQKHHWILKTDVDEFFESIDHDLLLEILASHIKDRRIVRLISLLIQNGGFTKQTYFSHTQGVHQGDSLSPLLSNIYLDKMDKFLESQQIPFIRFADDFAIFCDTLQEAESALKSLNAFLPDTLHLRLGEDKTLITHINDGFSFLGARFQGNTRLIDPARLDKAIANLHSFARRNEPFDLFVKNINVTIKTLVRYYVKIVNADSPQVEQLQNALTDTCIEKIILTRKNGVITSKGRFRQLLSSLEFFRETTAEQHTAVVDLMIAKAWESIAAEKPIKADTAPLDKKKEEYSKKLTDSSHLHITKPGIILGIAKNRFTIKESGKVIKSIPKSQITHIIIASDGVSISSNIIRECARIGIPIDFVDRNHLPYASFISFSASLSQNALMQLEVIRMGKSIEFAYEFIEGKAKNQINYLKYLDKYHKRFDKAITSMQKTLKSAKSATTANELMGYEGQISATYWAEIQSIIDEHYGFTSRITQGARDTINSCLNYGYAILYGKIRYALVKAGLSLHISYLHAHDETKPTLVFDMIEEFRAFVVDRVIFSMANKNEPLHVTKEGLLTEETKKLVAKNIFERLGSYTTWRKEQHKIEHIIFHQAYLLARSVRGEDKYAAFIGKF